MAKKMPKDFGASYTVNTLLLSRMMEQAAAYYKDLAHKVFSLLQYRNSLPAWVHRDLERTTSLAVSSMYKAIVYDEMSGAFGVHECRFIDNMQTELCEYRIELVQRFATDCVCALRDIINGTVGESDDD